MARGDQAAASRGRDKDALALFEKALCLHGSVLRPDDPRTAEVRNEYISLKKKQGKA